MTRRRAAMVMAALGAAVAVCALAALAVGSEHIPLSQLFAALAAKLTGAASPLSREQEVIVFSLRFPRIALAIGVGATLAMAGAAFQALLRNPLADPYVLGVSDGAALGSILAILLAAEIALPGNKAELPTFVDAERIFGRITEFDVENLITQS